MKTIVLTSPPANAGFYLLMRTFKKYSTKLPSPTAPSIAHAPKSPVSLISLSPEIVIF